MSNMLQEMTEDLQTRIRELAYMMWESAGRQHGMAVEYWLKAEGEVRATMEAAAARMMPGSVARSPRQGEAASQPPIALTEAESTPAIDEAGSAPVETASPASSEAPAHASPDASTSAVAEPPAAQASPAAAPKKAPARAAKAPARTVTPKPAAGSRSRRTPTKTDR